MCPILIFTHAIIKTMKIQSLVSFKIFPEKSTSLKVRCLTAALHQYHFRSSSLQKNNPYVHMSAGKISTVVVPNRLYEKNQFYEAPGMQIVEGHRPPIFPRHRITLQANRSTSHV